MVRKEVELLGAVGVGVCAEYGSLVHKHVEEAANFCMKYHEIWLTLSLQLKPSNI